MRSSGALEQGPALALDATGSPVEWAVYAFSPGCDTPLSLSASLSLPEDSSAWFALADYAAGAWSISGPLSADPEAALEPARHLSPSGNVYCAVIAAAGQQVTVESVALQAEEADGLPLEVTPISTYAAWTSLLVVEGRPAIVYWDPGADDLCFVSAANDCGTVWNAPVVVDAIGHTGQYPSAAIVDGRPAVSYFDATQFVLRYARADDPSGQSWSGGITLGVAGAGEFSCLAVVDGKPAASYWDLVGHRLRYIQAKDPEGKLWELPVVAVEVQQLNSETKLGIVDGHPAIAFSTSTPAGVHFVRANDPAGASWGLPATLSGTPGADVVGLDYFGGLPTICWTEGNPASVFLAQALDAAGSSWASGSEVEGISDPLWITLARVGAVPALAFADANGDLYYAAGLASDGSAWDAPFLLDSPGALGTALSLTALDGQPALCYYSEPLDWLCFYRLP